MHEVMGGGGGVEGGTAFRPAAVQMTTVKAGKISAGDPGRAAITRVEMFILDVCPL